MEKIFANELGNTIHLQVVEKQLEGVAGIYIYIAGPTSATELHITRREAEVLHRELSLTLGSLSE